MPFAENLLVIQERISNACARADRTADSVLLLAVSAFLYRAGVKREGAA